MHDISDAASEEIRTAVYIGDELISVNGQSLRNDASGDAVTIEELQAVIWRNPIVPEFHCECL